MKRLYLWSCHTTRLMYDGIGDNSASVEMPLLKVAMTVATQQEALSIRAQLAIKGCAVLRGQQVVMATFSLQ